ncbi:MAG: xanthine dehydrogenase family protein subunit M [Holophagales bacterium]|jgi:xanthine dehydrogenase YagS FAD-binding subunit|nr:xanthine dehydrogenase family protein subunit M [Holophagales bacterium]
MLPSFRYVRPRSVAEAVKVLSEPGARVHAGGTDLLGCLRDEVFDAKSVVSLSGLSDLKGISETKDGGLRIGALVTLSEIAWHPGIAKGWPALAQGAAAAASPQLRNQGTLGGNLCQRPRCWYFRGDFDCARKGGELCYAVEGENTYHAIFGGSGCFIVHPSDTASPLVALQATVRIAGPKGTRSLPVEKLFVLPAVDHTRETVLAPGEIVTEILLPPPLAGGKGLYRKVRARGAWDFALGGVALALSVKDGKVAAARVVLSGVAPVPWRVPEVEKLLVGHVLDAKRAAEAAELAVKGAEPMSGNDYKVPLVRGAVEEALLSLV